MRTGVLLHQDDLSPGFMLEGFAGPMPCLHLRAETALSPLQTAPHLTDFLDGAFEDTQARFEDRLKTSPKAASSAEHIAQWAEDHELQQLITPYAPVGPVAALLDAADRAVLNRILRVRRPYDSAAWPHATHGFFRFKDKIPTLAAPYLAAR